MWRASAAAALAVSVALSVGCGDRPQQPTPDTSKLSFLAGSDLEYVLTPETLATLGTPAGDDFDVSANDHVVLGVDTTLLEIARSEDHLTADRLMADQAPPRFALDGATLLGVRGRFVGALSDGALDDAVPLPVTDMRIAAAAREGSVYLFGGTDEVARRVYVLRERGALEIVAELPDPVIAVSEGSQALYLATAREVWRLTGDAPQLVVRFGPEDAVIQSIAITPDERVLFVGTANRLFAMHGEVMMAVVRDAGGEVRFRNNALWLWDRHRLLLVRITNVVQALSASSGAPQ